MTPEDLDELAEPYARIALDLATRVRDDDPVAVHRWLLQEMDGRDWLTLAVVQACATPIDVPWRQLTAWTWLSQLEPVEGDDEIEPEDPLLQPCGTHAAFTRHKVAGEKPCSECVEGEREYQRKAQQTWRSRRKAAA